MDHMLKQVKEMMERLKRKANDIRDEVQNEELQPRKKIKGEVSLWLGQVKEVKEMMEQLKIKANDIRDEVRNEELQPRKKIKGEVTFWLGQVSSVEEEAQSIEAEAGKIGFLGRRNFEVKLVEMVKRIGQLLNDGEFRRGLVLDDLNPLPLVTEEMEGSTPSRVQDKVWSCFGRGETRVGVYGMGGVGKTTVAMHINNKFLKPNALFDEVYYVTVSRDTSVSKLQNDIARALGIRFNFEDEPNRAAELSSALKKREKCLLILDDVWEDISMHKVGVSVEGDGCNLLITTRKKDVCQKMNCFAVQLEPLSKTEAWDLFVKQLGDYEALSNGAKEIARSVAQECAGLPLGIITVAGSMRGERCEHVWRDALRSLRSPCSSQYEMENKVFGILRFSYDRLYDEKHRKCFLLCALYPEDYEIKPEELISMFISTGLVDGGKRLENIDRGHALLNALVNASLLQHVTNWRGAMFIRMHDLVRDMAIKKIGSSGMVKGGNSLTEGPPEVEWNNKKLELVSLMRNHIEDIGGMTSPDCPKLSVLLLQENRGLQMIPDSFFLKMIGLKVVNLSCTRIEVLPDSVSSLVNLNSMLLSRCSRLQYIPSLSKLTSLKEMDLEGCRSMVKFPHGMEELVSLEHLNLDGSGIKGLHYGTVCKLGNLQVFVSNCMLFVPSKEVMSLRLLKMNFVDLDWFNKYVRSGCFDRADFCVIIGRLEDLRFYHNPLKSLIDEEGCNFDRAIFVDSNRWRIGTKCCVSVPRSTQLLLFNKCSFGGRSLLDVLPSLCHATKLELCKLEDCTGIKYIIPDEWSNPLEGIQALVLYKLKDFCGLIREGGVHPCISFGGLRRLEIKGCAKLKRLWLLNLELPNLEEIRIEECFAMAEIFAPAKGETIKLPKLRTLRLECLPELRSVWCDNVLFPNLLVLQINGCHKAKKIGFTSFSMPSLQTLWVFDCRQMEEIFAVQDETGDVNTLQLPNLETLKLRWLPELRSICKNTIVCNSLQLVELDDTKLESCPISIPRIFEANNNDPPPRLENWGVCNSDWWDSLYWNNPATKARLHQLGCLIVT